MEGKNKAKDMENESPNEEIEIEEIKEEKPEKKEKKEDKIEKISRDIIIPGEVIVSGEDYLPGENTFREGKNIISTKFGLVEYLNRLVKVIPLSGVYVPRRGNTIIGKVVDMNFNGIHLDINAPYLAFLGFREIFSPRGARDAEDQFAINDILTAKIYSIKRQGIDLTMRDRGLYKLEGGMTITINSNKVPRVIGKEGSMVNLIKQETGCSVVVGQNGIVWIRGDTIEAELLAKKAILFIASKSHIEGLTSLVADFFAKEKKNKGKE